MALAPLEKKPHAPPLRIAARQLACLQRWMSAAQQSLASEAMLPGAARASTSPSDRRGALRRQLETTATLRPISAGGPRTPQDASVVDVSRDGIALRLSDPLNNGQSISLQINPPAPRAAGAVPPRGQCSEPQGREVPIRILAVVRYCRPEAGSYVLGCSFGAEWAASLASEILPADLPALRKSA